jgi:hypothetical protein
LLGGLALLLRRPGPRHSELPGSARYRCRQIAGTRMEPAPDGMCAASLVRRHCRYLRVVDRDQAASRGDRGGARLVLVVGTAMHLDRTLPLLR